MKFIATTLISIISLVSGHTPRNLGESKTFNAINLNGDTIGYVKITQGHEGIVLRSNINCLSSGAHGYSIHKNASCEHEKGFSTAGAVIGSVETEQAREYACGYKQCNDGFVNRHGPQEGNLPNIISSCNSECECMTRSEHYNHMLNLFYQDNEKPALLVNGAAIVIFENEDSHDSGDSGSRFACVEIPPLQQE